MKTSNLGGGPKFKMGKIVSKNLIVEVLSYVETFEEIINRFLFSNRSLRCLVIENLSLIQNQAKEMDEIKVTFDYHQDNTMVLIPDECPKKYGFVVSSHNEIKNALQIAKARKSQTNPKICFDFFIIDYRSWTSEEDFPSKNLMHENYEIMRQIDQEGFQISILCHAKDLKSLIRVVNNSRGKMSLAIHPEQDNYPDYIK